MKEDPDSKSCCKRCCFRFNHPHQVSKSKKRHRCVNIVGRIGFTIKALLYGFIGYLCLKSVLGTKHDVNEAPQGVFIFLASYENVYSRGALLAIFCGMLLYAVWRFWEGCAGQGYDESFSHKKNFFRFRLSPMASGIVYSLYDIYIIYVVTGPKPPAPTASSRPTDATCFPICWKATILGNIGLALLAIAFTIAMITQLIETFTKKFHSEMNTTFFDQPDKWRCIRKTIKIIFYTAGHIGFGARSLYFGMVAYMLWRVLCGAGLFLDPTQSTVGQAVTAIQTTRAGEVLVGILGFGLLIYGFYVILCVIFRYFPTPPPVQEKDDRKSIEKENDSPNHHHSNGEKENDSPNHHHSNGDGSNYPNKGNDRDVIAMVPLQANTQNNETPNVIVLAIANENEQEERDGLLA